MQHCVIYLTGPPASGKSSLAKRLTEASINCKAFVYSEMLAQHVTKRSKVSVSQRSLRSKSSSVVGVSDIAAVDEELIGAVKLARLKSHVVIDSHAVTKETFGFRVTPFSVSQLVMLAPTCIATLVTNPSAVIKRILKHSKGRPQVDEFEAGFHCALQSSLSLMYGWHLGIPMYFFDSSESTDSAFVKLMEMMNQTEKRSD